QTDLRRGHAIGNRDPLHHERLLMRNPTIPGGTRGFMAAALLAACGCSGIKSLEPATPMSKAVYFKEQDYYGRVHPLSATTTDRKNVERIPAPGAVDINSSIVVELRKEQLLPSKTPTLDSDQFR